MSPQRTLVRAAGCVDAQEVASPPGRPGAVLLEHDAGHATVLAAGDAQTVAAHPGASGATIRDLPAHVLLPALVNAHTHLDLTLLGPRPYRPLFGFVGWLAMIRRARRKVTHDPGEATAAGCRLSRRGGVAAVGDIAGGVGAAQLAPLEALRASGLEGVSFIEVFGMGGRQEATIALLEGLLRDGPPLEERGVRLGLQPHAPYSAGLRVYAAAARLAAAHDLPICTHLAESMAERRLVAEGAGPLRTFLRALHLWDDSYLTEIGLGNRPVAHLAEVLSAAPWLVVHVNDCTPDEIELLARAGASVAYCPRASSYFHHHEAFGPHRYRDMLDAGINVALGTDSIVNLPEHESDRLSTLDEMRFLWRRDRTSPRTLLAMATTNGALALSLDPSRFTLAAGPLSGLIAIDVAGTDAGDAPAKRIVESGAQPQWIWPEPADGAGSRA